jgi:hypothetical protein
MGEANLSRSETLGTAAHWILGERIYSFVRRAQERVLESEDTDASARSSLKRAAELIEDLLVLGDNRVLDVASASICEDLIIGGGPEPAFFREYWGPRTSAALWLA